jgi:hypothetical protein
MSDEIRTGKTDIVQTSLSNLPEEEFRSLPPGVAEFLKQTGDASPTNPISVDTIHQIFGKDSSVAQSLQSSGVAFLPNHNGKSVVIGAGYDSQGAMISTAAAIPRSPGASENYLQEVTDFTDTGTDRATLLELYERIYLREGIVNNAINKASALVATEGEFKVRYVKGKRGISGNKQAEELHKLLQFWQENVNSRAEEAAVTGDRGLKAFMAQGVRMTLKQGDHFARANWDSVNVPVLGKAYSLPMSLQTFDGRTIEIPEGLEGTAVELFYWVPPREFIQSLQSPRDPNVKEYLEKFIPQDVRSELVKSGKYLLIPKLMLHIKHRGTSTSNYGVSMIEAAMSEIAYKRALQALDLVTIENLINRLVIIMVGSDDKDSIYHAQAISNSRMSLMSNMLRRVGPAATIIWPGPDIEIKEVGAYNSILDMDERYRQSEARIRNALGVPSALLSGDSADGKAAGWAAIMGLAAELSEVRDQYRQAFRSIAEQIAIENGFEDVNVTWEFTQPLLTNRNEHVSMILDGYRLGVFSNQRTVTELGFSFEAEEVLMQEDVDKGYRSMPFGPPRALENNMRNDTGDGGEGRPPNPNETDPRQDQETQETEERN